jgi:hypothetical protein
MMPLNAVSCVLCGVRIMTGPSWFGQFRARRSPHSFCIASNAQAILAVYADDMKWDDPRLSGVGVRGDAEDRVPIDPALKYDNLAQDSMKELWLLSPYLIPPPSMAVQPALPDPAWGFPFHASCWRLVQTFCPPTSSRLQYLAKVLLSFPQENGFVNWGHTYGDIVRFNKGPISALPVEDYYLVPKPLDGPGLSAVLCDPIISLSDFYKAIKSTSVPTHDFAKVSKKQSRFGGKDPLGGLPIELLQMVLFQLPSADVLSVKLASSTMASLPLTESFWASRFGSHHEYEYIFESKRLACNFGWRRLYFAMKNAQDQPYFVNRRRIWKLSTLLEEMVRKASCSSCSGTSVYSFFEPDAPADDALWNMTSLALKGPADLFNFGCRALRCRRISLPGSIAGVFVSFIELDKVKYVSGLRFQRHSGDDVCLGYIHSRQEFALSFKHTSNSGNKDS